MNIHEALKFSQENKRAAQSAAANTPQSNAHTTKSEPAQINAAPAFVAVTVEIAGTSHHINCPSDEIKNLETAATYIDDKVCTLRQNFKSKNLSNEELLVLTCLELHDQLTTLQAKQRINNEEWQQNQLLLSEIIKDAQSIL